MSIDFVRPRHQEHRLVFLAARKEETPLTVHICRSLVYTGQHVELKLKDGSIADGRVANICDNEALVVRTGDRSAMLVFIDQVAEISSKEASA